MRFFVAKAKRPREPQKRLHPRFGMAKERVELRVGCGKGAELRRRHSWYGVQQACAVEAVTGAANSGERVLVGDERVRLVGRFPVSNEWGICVWSCGEW